MNSLLTIKTTKQLNKTVYFYFFNWGFLFFSASYFTYNKLILHLANIQGKD